MNYQEYKTKALAEDPEVRGEYKTAPSTKPFEQRSPAGKRRA